MNKYICPYIASDMIVYMEKSQKIYQKEPLPRINKKTKALRTITEPNTKMNYIYIY